jgi:microcystin-dependent protein
VHPSTERYRLSEPFIGEIRLVPWSFAPRGWAFCDGTTLSIAQNQALFSLLGTTYGGDGMRTFNLPDLRGRAAMGYGGAVALGAQIGEPAHTLVAGETPAHVHFMNAATTPGTLGTVAPGQWLAGITDGKTGFGYAPPPSNVAEQTTLEPSSIAQSGGGQSHENRQPYLCLSYAIAVEGLYPSRT